MVPVYGSPFPPGTIVMATGGPPRYGEFWSCMNTLQAPNGSFLAWSRTYDAASGRELMVRNRLKKGGWVWFMDDDHTFEPDCLMKMLEHRLPVVAPVACRRRTPCKPIMIRENGVPYEWDELYPGGLLALDPNSTVGMGGLLVWEEVFAKLEPPYFRVGQFDPAYMQEDVYFCRSLWAAGETIVVDRDRILGHCDTAVMLPKRTPEGWDIEFITGYREQALRKDSEFTQPPALFYPVDGGSV